jgi:hypothetical protein
MLLKPRLRILFIAWFRVTLYLLRSSMAPGSGLTTTPIEMVSKPSPLEAMELLQKDQD